MISKLKRIVHIKVEKRAREERKKMQKRVKGKILNVASKKKGI